MSKKTSWAGHIRPLIVLGIISLLLAGLFFPFLITGIGQTVFPYQANGDIVKLNGHGIGSYYIDNGFTQPVFFHARNESACGCSGVDPDITLEQAYAQIPTISHSTGIANSSLTAIVNDNTEGTFWIFGSPYVNVLNLNLILIHDYPSVYANYPK